MAEPPPFIGIRLDSFTEIFKEEPFPVPLRAGKPSRSPSPGNSHDRPALSLSGTPGVSVNARRHIRPPSSPGTPSFLVEAREHTSLSLIHI